MNIKSNKNKSSNGKVKSAHLKNSIEYILDPVKTENGLLCGSVNCICDKDMALSQMLYTKEHFGKNDKRQGYHFVISLKPGEGDTETMMKITEEFIERYFKNAYEIVYAVHNNTDKIHSHIVFNSVNCVDGKKYRYNNGDWEKEIQSLVNEICLKYNLSTLENKRNIECKNISYDKIRDDIDDVILLSKNFDDFISRMRSMNYKISYGKYLTVRPEGRSRNVRTKTLGTMYTEAMIKNRIAMIHSKLKNTNEKKIISRPPKIKYIRSKRIKYNQMTKYQKKILVHHLKIKRMICRRDNNKKTWKQEVDYRKLRQNEKRLFYIYDNNIKSYEDLESHYNLLQDKSREFFSKIKELENENKIYEKIISAWERIKEIEGKTDFSNKDNISDEENHLLYAEYIACKNLISNSGHTEKEVCDYIENYEIRKSNLIYLRKENYKNQKMVEKMIEEYRMDNYCSCMIKNDIDNIDSEDISFDELSNFYLYKAINFEQAMNRHVKIDYSSEEAYYVVNRLNPTCFIEVHTKRDIYNGEEYTRSDYFLYKNNNLIKNGSENYFSDKKTDNQPQYYWYNLKKEILKQGSFDTNDIVIMKKRSFDRYTEAYKNKDIDNDRIVNKLRK